MAAEIFRVNDRVTIAWGDCVEFMASRQCRDDRADLIFADPPFNIGQDYGGYDDKRPAKEYRRFLYDTISHAVHVWGKNLIALHGDDRLAVEYLKIAEDLLLKRVAWVNWHYRFGVNCWSNWVPTRAHLLVFSITGEKHTWNPEAVAVPSDRAAVYGDKRVGDYARGGKRPPGTVWGVPSDGPYWGRVQGTNAERVPERPNQLPEVYLERIIRAYTNPGDLVFDPFCGTGTTAVVADALGRRCVTVDIDKESCRLAIERVKQGAVRIKQASE